MAEAKIKSILDVQSQVNKKSDRIMFQFNDEIDDRPEVISTGILALDQALGGGFPRGCNVELMGPEQAGKTGIAVQYLAQAQKYGACAFIDLENTFDIVAAERAGVDLDSLYIAQPESAEDTLELVRMLLQAQDVSAIIVDSVAGMTPRSEIEGSIGDSHVGLQARLMSQGLRLITTEMRTKQLNHTIVWINQLREKIGSMGFGPKTTTTGGRALKFYSATRIEVARIGGVESGGEIIGQKVKTKVVKNKFYPAYKTAEFDIIYERGISNSGTLLDLAIQGGLIEQNKGWHVIKHTGEKINGRQAVIAAIEENPDLYEYLNSQLF